MVFHVYIRDVVKLEKSVTKTQTKGVFFSFSKGYDNGYIGYHENNKS